MAFLNIQSVFIQYTCPLNDASAMPQTFESHLIPAFPLPNAALELNTAFLIVVFFTKPMQRFS